LLGFFGMSVNEMDAGGGVCLSSEKSTIFQSVLDAIGDGFAVMDVEGRMQHVNPWGRRLLGIPDGTSHSTHPIWRYAPEIFRQFQRRSGGSSQVFDCQTHYPEKMLLRVTCLPLPEGLWAIILHDRTAEEKRQEDTLEQETGMLVQLLVGNLAHELGNPLNSLRIQLQLLNRRIGRRRREERESVAICEEEVERMHSLLSCFLDSLRPVQPSLREVDLEEVVHRCLRGRREEMERAGVQLLLEFPREKLPILGDRELLRQALLHILRNALEALDGGGHITIALTGNETHAILAIEDDGVGIAGGDLPMMLAPRFTTKPMGNGLGLMAVQRTIHAHRGTVAVHAIEPHGFRIELHLPLIAPRLQKLQDGPRGVADVAPA
jgi:signal transduction histidine kinase